MTGIVGVMPNQIADGQTNAAGPVMANFNWIMAQVNANAAAAGVNGDITQLTALTSVNATATGGAALSVASAVTVTGSVGASATGGAALSVASAVTVTGSVGASATGGAALSVASAANLLLPGWIIDFAGTVAPAGFLACPTAVTNISRTTYAALFAAIGTQWGAGDGSTTFGIPYFPVGYAAIQGGTVGSASSGQMPSHAHNASSGYFLEMSTSTKNGGVSSGTVNYWGSIVGATAAAGSGSINYGAGMNILMCVKY